MTDHHNDGHEDHTSDHHADDENGHQNCFDFEARTVLYVEDEYLPSVRERFTAATMEAVVDGKLESAISQYNPSYGDGTISEMRGTVPMDQQQESVWTTGVIAGVASAAGVVLLLALYFIWRRCHGRKKSGNADGVASNSTGSSDGNGSDDETLSLILSTMKIMPTMTRSLHRPGPNPLQRLAIRTFALLQWRSTQILSLLSTPSHQRMVCSFVKPSVVTLSLTTCRQTSSRQW